MNTIARLKQLMIDEGLKVHNISVALNVHVGTVTRWLRTGTISLSYERILNDWLVSKGK